MSNHHLAQINVAKPLYARDDPRFADFVNALDEINAVADRDPGFVWRLQDDTGNAIDLRDDSEPDLMINMSVWRSAEALHAYVYRSAHAPFVGRRKEWFERETVAIMALWWVPAGHLPTVEEGMERLRKLRAEGPTPEAFSFKQQFPPPA